MAGLNGEMSDERLWIDGLRKGDRAAFDTVYRAYHGRLYTLALRYLKNQADAEDVVQQLFVKLWSVREALYITQSLRGYLYGMLKHAVLNYIRNEKSALQHNYCIVQKQPQYDDDLYTYAERHFRTELLEQAIRTLPPQQRIVATLRCEGYSNQEIALRLHLSVHTVNTHYRACVKRLKGLLLPVVELIMIYTMI